MIDLSLHFIRFIFSSPIFFFCLMGSGFLNGNPIRDYKFLSPHQLDDSIRTRISITLGDSCLERRKSLVSSCASAL